MDLAIFNRLESWFGKNSVFIDIDIRFGADFRCHIDEVLRDSGYAAELGENARRFVVPRYGLDTMLTRMEGIFRQALADAGR